jgi:hypothetical protein
VAKALAVVLLTWNRRFYSTGIPFDAEHFADIEALLACHQEALRGTEGARSSRPLAMNNAKSRESSMISIVYSGLLARQRHFTCSHPGSFRFETGR